MPVARFQMPDGRVARFEVPDGTTPEQAQTMMEAHFSQSQPAQAAPAQKESALDAPNAVGTGYNRGLAALAGLPVDTVMNVIDLGKAAIGAPYTAITGSAPDALAYNPDRSGIVGSRDWILRQARKTDTGRSIVDPMNPDYEGGYLQAAGSGLTAVMSPSSRAQLVNQAVTGPAAAMLGKAAYESLGAMGFDESAKNAGAVASSFFPTIAQQGVTSATKYAIRGGEQGRKQMEQRVQNLRNAGIDQPTLGLASGNEAIGGVENILQSTPGAVKVMRNARDRIVAGAQAKTDEAANTAAGSRSMGNTEVGNAIRSDISGPFMERFKATQTALYDKLDQYIKSGDSVNVEATRKALHDLTKVDPSAKNLSSGFINGKIQDIRNRFDMDTGEVAGIPGTSYEVPIRSGSVISKVDLMGRKVPVGTQTRSEAYVSPERMAQPINALGSPIRQQANPFSGVGIPTNEAPSARTIPAQSMSKLSVAPGGFEWVTNAMGERVAVPIASGTRTIETGPTGRRSNPLSAGAANFELPPPELPYSALKQQRTNVGEQLSNELLSGAPNAQWKRLYAGMSEDMQGAAQNAGPDAERAFIRANDFTRSWMNRLERIRSFADKEAAPETIYNRLVKASETGSSTLQAVKKSLTPDTRGQMAGTLIEQLGKATGGKQNAAGDVWSPETFLTNWNKIKAGRQELLSGFEGADKVRSQVEAVAKATSMMRDSSKMWANPSGTAANIGARATLGAIGGGLFLDPTLAAAAGGGVLSANLLARALTSKGAVEAATRKNALSQSMQAANARVVSTQSEERKKK